MAGPIEFRRPTHSSQAQAGAPLPMEERLWFSVPVKQPLFQDTKNSTGKVCSLPPLRALTQLLVKITRSVLELTGQHFSSHQVYEDKIISTAVTAHNASLDHQILPQRFETTLKTKLQKQKTTAFCY